MVCKKALLALATLLQLTVVHGYQNATAEHARNKAEMTLVSLNAHSDLVVEESPMATSTKHHAGLLVNGTLRESRQNATLLNESGGKSEEAEIEIGMDGDISAQKHARLAMPAQKERNLVRKTTSLAKIRQAAMPAQKERKLVGGLLAKFRQAAMPAQKERKLVRKTASLAKIRKSAWTNAKDKGPRTTNSSAEKLMVRSFIEQEEEEEVQSGGASNGKVGKPAKGENNEEDEDEDKGSGFGPLRIAMVILGTMFILFVLTVAITMWSRQYRVDQPFGGRYILNSE